MVDSPGSLASLRTRNRLSVVETVQRRGSASRAEITRSTGLSRSTVSSLVAELLTEGVLAEPGERVDPAGVPSGGGRPATLLTLNPARGGVLGVHLGHDGVRVVFTDLSGGALGERYAELDVDHRLDDSLAYAADAALALPADSGVDIDRVLGMGVAVSAPMPHALRSPPLLRGWDDVDIAGRLRARTGLAIHLGNDADLGAMAEWTFGVGRGVDDLVYVMLSDGVGAGLILNGHPYQGATGTAGELGHVAVVDDGYVCRCGNRGCLETVVGSRALVASFAHSRGPHTTLADVVALAAADDPGCRRVLLDAGRTIGRALAGVCAVLDPRLVVIGGHVAASGAPLPDGVREVLARNLPAAISDGIAVEPGRLGDRAEALGAVALVVRGTSPHLLAS